MSGIVLAGGLWSCGGQVGGHDELTTDRLAVQIGITAVDLVVQETQLAEREILHLLKLAGKLVQQWVGP